ncbi:MAG: hypothetical protein DIU61_002020 [Bacteroidota bacterium]|jgi:hypothetical protein|nr:MAG: hypothetical protein DIU61_08175 [Bacteroidota bacterium]
MRYALITIAILGCVLSAGCRKPAESDDRHDHAGAPTSGQVEGELYDEVMRLHDEGMEKMDEIYALKRKLTQKIADAPGLVEEERQELESRIMQLDSASRAMMVWMREFRPESDTLDAEGYRDYLESELQKVRKVRDDIFAAVERASRE